MGKIDTLTKNYMANSAVFADAFNFLVYKGRQVIDPESLNEMDSTELAVLFGESNKLVDLDQRYRDVIRSATFMTDEKMTYVILGVENQDKIHYAMPVKNCIYDALQYVKQVKAIAARHKRDGDSKWHTSDEFLSGFYKGDRIKPVVTLVVYFGYKEWDGPMSLKEMMEEQDQEMMEFVQDYKINLIQPAGISNPDFGKFHSDLGTVLKFIKLSRNYEEMLAWKQTGDMGILSRDAALVVEACTNTVIDVPEGSEVVSVCEAIDMMNQKAAEAAAKAAAKTAAKEQNIKTLLASVKALTESLGLSHDEAMSALKVSGEDRSTLMTLL